MKSVRIHSQLIASSICTLAFALMLYAVYNVAIELGQILINSAASI